MFVLGAFVLMILSELSQSSSKRNNLDLYDPIGGLSEHGGLREPPETHLDLPLSSTMTPLLVILKYHAPMQLFHCCKNDNFQLIFFIFS